MRDLLVASETFDGQVQEIPTHIAALARSVDGHVAGNPLALFHSRGRNDTRGPTFEVCLPVRPSAKHASVRLRVVEGGVMLCATRSFSPGDSEPAWGDWSEMQPAIQAHLERHEVDLEHEPARELHRLLPNGNGFVEIQIPLLFPRWLDRFRSGIVRSIRNPERAYILRGEAHMGAHSSPEEQLAWVTGAIQRLESTCGNPALARRILHGCAPHASPETIATLRALYHRTGKIAAVVDALRTEPAIFGEVELQGNVFYTTSLPAHPAAYAGAGNETERRAASCYRALGRRAIRRGVPLPDLFCHCGAGVFVQLWESVLRQPVEAEVIESLLRGDPHCRFAIHLPPEPSLEEAAEGGVLAGQRKKPTTSDVARPA